MLIFSIESSHDDTSFAICKNKSVLWMKTISQIEVHKKYGGTVPEIASRLHSKNIAILIEEIKTEIDFNKIDLIAYTKEPGLIGSLHIGYIVANTISILFNKPIIGLNHLEGHFYSAFIDKEVMYPALGLIASGGHTQLVLYKSKNDYQLIGETQDDAIGEAYDKVARKLKIGFPGGPIIDEYWKKFHKIYLKNYSIPETNKKYDFSLSGLKTNIINLINNDENRKRKVDTEKYVTEFQNTIIKYLYKKMKIAIEEFHPNCIVLSGGVSANYGIRNMFLKLHKHVFLPDLKYTTDNAGMIGRLAYEKERGE